MSVTVGVREFRRDLAEYIDGDEPVTVTRHGRRVGVFVPARDDRAEAIAAYQATICFTAMKLSGLTDIESMPHSTRNSAN